MGRVITIDLRAQELYLLLFGGRIGYPVLEGDRVAWSSSAIPDKVLTVGQSKSI